MIWELLLCCAVLRRRESVLRSGRKKRAKRICLGFIAAAAAVTAAFLVYAMTYYRAFPEALDALESDTTVTVTSTEYGVFFDGPSTDSTLVFYPGGRVDERAYAPLLHDLAGSGVDVCLVEMPLKFAFFDINKADDIIDGGSGDFYIGGHSLGGAMAAVYAADHPDKVKGVILFAAYPTSKIADSTRLLSIYGSEDKVLSADKVEKGREYAPEDYREFVIKGGNHAGFGCYGKQAGDGEALISGKKQRDIAVEQIALWLSER